jgi:hypothetical protein
MQDARMLACACSTTAAMPGGDSHDSTYRLQAVPGYACVSGALMRLHRLTQQQHTLAGPRASPVLDAILLAPAHHRHHVVYVGRLLALHVDAACRGG